MSQRTRVLTISRTDAALWGVFDCTCCGDGCDCGCVTLCPVGLERHEAFRAWLASDVIPDTGSADG